LSLPAAILTTRWPGRARSGSTVSRQELGLGHDRVPGLDHHHHAAEAVGVPELADRGERLRVDQDGALGALGEAQHPAVSERQHAGVGVVRERRAAEDPDGVAHAL